MLVHEKPQLGSGDPGFHLVDKARVIANGLRCAVVEDFSVLYKLVLSVPVLLLALYLQAWLDTALILLATGAMLSAELFNTTIEALCHFIEEREHPEIRMIKDVAAAATGMAIWSWAAVMVIQMVGLPPRIWGIGAS